MDVTSGVCSVQVLAETKMSEFVCLYYTRYVYTVSTVQSTHMGGVLYGCPGIWYCIEALVSGEYYL